MKESNIEIPKFRFALREDLQKEKKFLPTRSTPVATGWDVRCAQKDRKQIIVRPGHYVKIDLGFRVIPPEGWWLKLNPRSSTFAKKSLHCLYGVIDNDFRSGMIFVAQHLPDVRAMGVDLTINFGDAIGQLIPVRLENMVVDEVSNEEYDQFCKNETDNIRGEKGFGGVGG